MPQHILVIEDEPQVLERIVQVLKAEGYMALGVTSGQVAVEKALQVKPVIIILDETLPDLHFEQVILHIRKAAKSTGTSAPLFLFMLSRETLRRVGNGVKEISALFPAPEQQSQPEYMITKPFNPSELIAAIGRMQEECGKSMSVSGTQEQLGEEDA